MSTILYDYKKFLGDFDKIVKKYFDLKWERKEQENLRKIGLNEYFEPVTSVIKKDLRPILDLISKDKVLEKVDLRLKMGSEERSEEGSEEGSKVGSEEGSKEGSEAVEDIIETVGADPEFFEPEDLDKPPIPSYGESLHFDYLQKLNNAYPKEKRGTSEYYEAWKNTVNKDNIYEEGRTDFNNFTDNQLEIEQKNLNNIKNSSKAQSKFNTQIKQIKEDVTKQIN